SCPVSPASCVWWSRALVWQSRATCWRCCPTSRRSWCWCCCRAMPFVPGCSRRCRWVSRGKPGIERTAAGHSQRDAHQLRTRCGGETDGSRGFDADSKGNCPFGQLFALGNGSHKGLSHHDNRSVKIGRASCRERVELSVVLLEINT